MNNYNEESNIFERTPDVEVVFHFNGKRTRPCYNLFRPIHRVRDDYLTTGIHRYFGVESVPGDGTAHGTITFITPEEYPHCLWVGKKIDIYDGYKLIGYATVTRILNDLLSIEG